MTENQGCDDKQHEAEKTFEKIESQGMDAPACDPEEDDGHRPEQGREQSQGLTQVNDFTPWRPHRGILAG
jgi:hypothetical protein